MARPKGRLGDIQEAALRVFMEKGYRRTQMADVARAMRVSPGTLYNYVQSKAALFHLVIDRAFLPRPPGALARLPIPAPPPGATIARLRQRLAEEAVLPALDAALGRNRPGDPRRELEGILGELHDLIARTRLAITLIERSALDLPELAALFFHEVRRGLLRRLEEYLHSRIAGGSFRPVPDAAAAARLLLEAIAWFAMHRHRDPDTTMSDEIARRTVLHFAVSALVKDRAARRPRAAGGRR
jgi:AcrR family transcriptional regulator